ncbi:MAG: DNA-binding response regulator [Actinobacteria bacterium]|nr:DNA-binding response regulator [Actinomycetota bacterium]
MTRRVLIVDDHPIVRAGLEQALIKADFSICAVAASKNEAMAQIARTNPNLILLDLNLPDGSGFEVASWVRGISDTTGIVILTLNDAPELLLAALAARVSGFVLKSAPITEVIATLERALVTPLSFTASGLHKALKAKERLPNLSSREFEVLSILATGKSTREIARELYLSEPTIKTHLASIYRKLEVNNRISAVAVARENSWLGK